MNWKLLVAEKLPGGLVARLWEFRKRWMPSARQAGEIALFKKLGDPDTILHGPFEGMKYQRIAFAGSTLDKTVGAYETEIVPAVETMIAANPDKVIDIGTSEGYYAVGMARRLPGASVIGYDMLKICQFLTRRLAAKNDVADRVQVRGACSTEDLQRELATAKHPAVVCDCDGAESFLIDPVAVPALKRSTILIELHDMMVPGISDEIHRRFVGTHLIEKIPVRAPSGRYVPAKFNLNEADAAAVQGDARDPVNFWYLMTPKASD